MIRYAITDAGRAALAEHPVCHLCDDAAGGEIFNGADIGTTWTPLCIDHLDAARAHYVVREWPQ